MKKENKKERKMIDDKDLNNVSGGAAVNLDASGIAADNDFNALETSAMLNNQSLQESVADAQGILEVTALTGRKRKIDSSIKDNLNQNNTTIKYNNK